MTPPLPPLRTFFKKTSKFEWTVTPKDTQISVFVKVDNVFLSFKKLLLEFREILFV